MFVNKRNILWGIFLILLGIVLGLNALKVTNINLFFKGWWTFIIIMPCLINLISEKNRKINIIGLVIGVFLLLCCLGIINFSLLWELFVPAILIAIGFILIYKDTNNINGKNNKKDKRYIALFGGKNLDFSNEDFLGCKLISIFGGITCDLKKCNISKDVMINAKVIFGGIDILVSDDVNINISGISIFGGVSDKKKNELKEKNKNIYIKSICVFGGVDVK